MNTFEEQVEKVVNELGNTKVRRAFDDLVSNVEDYKHRHSDGHISPSLCKEHMMASAKRLILVLLGREG